MLHRVEQALDSLAAGEGKVARLLLADPERLLHEPIARVAERAGTSEPTVVRFCRSVGCDGFRQLKLELARSLERDARSLIHADIDGSEDAAGLIEKVTLRAIGELTTLREELEPAAFAEAADLLAGADAIEFWGMGVSGLVANDAQNRFFRLGLRCVAYSDAPTLRQTGAIRRSGDVIVAISHSGASQPVLAACDDARGRGAQIVAVTSPGTALADRADCLLGVRVDEDPGRYTPSSSRLAHLLVLDILQVQVAIRLGDAALENLRQTKEAIRQS